MPIITFERFVTTEFGTKLWIGLGRNLPPRAGRALARLITGIIARWRGSFLYRTIYSNQSVLLGPAAKPAQVHRAARAMLGHAGMTSYDLMRHLALGEDSIRSAVEFGPEVFDHMAVARSEGRGVILCGPHLSNFNLGFLALALHDIPMQVLSVDAPAGGFALLRELRGRGLLEETPVSRQSLRAAIHRLRQAGLVVTGVDWPGGLNTETLPFFDRPAHLPTGHVRLAMTANARLMPVACRWDPARGYYVHAAPPMDLELTGDRASDVRHNARRVLAVIEQWISETPDQWLMYHPVWPDALVNKAGSLG